MIEKTRLVDILSQALIEKASDIHISVNLPPVYRVNGKLVFCKGESFTPTDLQQMTDLLLNKEQKEIFVEKGEIDFAYSISGLGRFRINLYRQRGTPAIAIRVIPDRIPSLEELGLPEVVRDFTKIEKGLILVTGPTGSGKSTTLAAMIDIINNERSCHVITIEDPIEYLHKHRKSIIHQREVGEDTRSFVQALRAALREDPDVILIGEMRDLETTATAITAAETGHLVLSTLHTASAVSAVERIIDIFPANQQSQIRVQLADVLQGVIAQKLVPLKNNTGRAAAVEIMVATPAVKNLIREGKTHQLYSVMQTGMKYAMQTMEQALYNLFNKNLISRETLENALKEHSV
jgi:twitching motility protein PilT